MALTAMLVFLALTVPSLASDPKIVVTSHSPNVKVLVRGTGVVLRGGKSPIPLKAVPVFQEERVGVVTNQIDSWTDGEVFDNSTDSSEESNSTFVPPKLPPPAVAEKDFNVPEAHQQTLEARQDTSNGMKLMIDNVERLTHRLKAAYNATVTKWELRERKDEENRKRREAIFGPSGSSGASGLEGEGSSDSGASGASGGDGDASDSSSGDGY